MYKNYLKIAWRNLLRNKGFSALNIIGLSIGLAVTMLILLWINFERSYDQFHVNKNLIYEVNNQYKIDGDLITWNSTPKIMGPTIKKDYPEVEYLSRVNYDMPLLFSKEKLRLKALGNIVDPDFLRMFSFPLLKGDASTALNEINSVVITQSLAEKLFGNENPIGKTVKLHNSINFTITGVLENLPQNTQFNFEYLIPWSIMKQLEWDDENWGNNSVTTYVMLKKGTNYKDFSSKIKNLRKVYDKETPDMITYLYPFSRTYLYSKFENGKEIGGKIDLIRLFGIIAVIILIIACINFMNLSTARSEKRAKEVGVRKVVGANKNALVAQFMGESILISFISAILAFGIVLLAMPAFNNLIGKELMLDLTNSWFWVAFLTTVLLTGILAGSYPALYLSSFKPSSVLKGTFKKVNTLVTPRRILVVMQFSVAIILITATIIVRQQLQKVQDRQLGYAKNNLIYSVMEGDAEKNYDLIKEELLSSGTALSVTKTGSPITESWSNSWGMEWKGKRKDDKTVILRLPADNSIVQTLGLQLVEGRDFDLQQYPTDSTALILNETASEHMGFDNPIGQIVRDNGVDWHVVGVVKDFVFNSPFQKIEPLMIEGAKAWFQVIHIKLNNANTISENLADAEAIFKKYNQEYPFNYEFVDQEYSKKFNDQKRTEKLAGLFTFFTILISCLGLFGLAAYMAENRIKEIGVRKVLGATVASITTLLSKDFLKLVLLACCIAVPISWYTMDNWLDDFEYRVTISWWTFIMAGALALIIAFLTVSYQSIRAALTNPVKSLRTE